MLALHLLLKFIDHNCEECRKIIDHIESYSPEQLQHIYLEVNLMGTSIHLH